LRPSADSVFTRKYACKYTCDKFEDIKSGNKREEKGMEEGLTGGIRPERNGSVIVTDAGRQAILSLRPPK